jgi:hypothetical protein
MPSWPSLIAAAIAMWLLLKGPIAKTPAFVQKGYRIVIAFFAYCGFLYLLKWNPFWKWMLSLGIENRNKDEGFLILLSTFVWLVTTLRILFSRLHFIGLGAGSRGISNRDPRQAKTPSNLTLKNLAIFYYFFTRK